MLRGGLCMERFVPQISEVHVLSISTVSRNDDVDGEH